MIIDQTMKTQTIIFNEFTEINRMVILYKIANIQYIN